MARVGMSSGRFFGALLATVMLAGGCPSQRLVMETQSAAWKGFSVPGTASLSDGNDNPGFAIATQVAMVSDGVDGMWRLATGGLALEYCQRQSDGQGHCQVVRRSTKTVGVGFGFVTKGLLGGSDQFGARTALMRVSAARGIWVISVEGLLYCTVGDSGPKCTVASFQGAPAPLWIRPVGVFVIDGQDVVWVGNRDTSVIFRCASADRGEGAACRLAENR